MVIKVQKWGNSLAIRIPKSFAKETEIDQGALIDISVVEGKLVATPVREIEYSLSELLSQVTKDNLHSEIDTGESVGKEVW